MDCTGDWGERPGNLDLQAWLCFRFHHSDWESGKHGLQRKNGHRMPKGPPDPPGCPKVHPDPPGCPKVHPDPPECPKVHTDPPRCPKVHPKPLRCPKIHTQNHQDVQRSTQNHQDVQRSTQIHHYAPRSIPKSARMPKVFHRKWLLHEVNSLIFHRLKLSFSSLIWEKFISRNLLYRAVHFLEWSRDWHLSTGTHQGQ